MKRQTIGKIQLWIGTILLIVGIFGAWFFYMDAKSDASKYYDYEVGSGNLGTDTLSIFILEDLLIIERGINFLAFSLLGILISFLFITQGLANMSTESGTR
ncbi:hypothetical protein HYT23_05965 [Candidatus Pacearchaeota archaeon]|nr:hypothetical protein [Candidatus Pacearchaeota archaeon]